MTDPQHGQPELPPAPDSARPSLPARLRRYWWALLPVGLLLIGLLVAAVVGHALYHAVRLTEPATVSVHERESFARVAATMQQQGLIPSARILSLYANRTHTADKIKPGVYRVENGARPVDILAMLVEGTKPVAFYATLPEGKWLTEYPEYLKTRWPMAAAEFCAATGGIAEWQTQVPFPLDGPNLEGYLFPDTYEFSVDATAPQMVDRMLKTFGEKPWKAYQTERSTGDARSLYEVLVLASLVESEAKVGTERPIIAGVITNRLRKRMPLQIDASVIYAHKKRLKRVLYKDLEIDSPYNTYKVLGLPIGPICNPGQESFRAALNPARTDALYYVARGDGSHIFSRTLQEHNAAIREAQGR